MASNAVESLWRAAHEGDRRSLARLLSHVERADETSEAVAALVLPQPSSWVIGLTGAPGAGKSTLADALLRWWRARDVEVAVLAVDPSSPITSGAILGDRIRMQEHANDPGVFVRSMASRGHSGGLTAAAHGAVAVLASVFPIVIVETVGVGQVEVEVIEVADTVAVVLTPGWGDGIQAGKAGIMEVADVFVVNKADRPGADHTVRDIEAMLAMAPPDVPWTPPIVRTSATTATGISELVDALQLHRAFLETDNNWTQRRRARVAQQLRRAVADHIRTEVNDRLRSPEIDTTVALIESGELSVPMAVQRVMADQFGHDA